ncbi:hypothetical protein GCM10011416_00890 [Polaribacter pacificus]|uniref:Uncharacterized protein n=1 Tax=Polaribacter pacificus TaxID=1775173 RepID=A0A917MAT2_9FLAO|nr:hypothetical protein [Polaribacter pacificus]GGG88449.1 hypothetical protein GCM10011416_00890 [Polaribacter pacificus]
MATSLYTGLKENILEEFKQVTAVLEHCELTSPKTFLKPFTIDSVSLLNTNEATVKSLLKEQFSKLSKDVIYKVEVINVIDKDEIISSFKKAKETKHQGRAYSKFNEENVDFIKENKSQNITLYIGSSKAKSVLNRIRCHLGLGAKGTYSMHLKSWLPASQKCMVRITLLELSCPSEGSHSINILELIEQALWNKEKPLLGKQSGLL